VVISTTNFLEAEPMSDHLKEVAIAGLVVLEVAAICAGIDGAYFGIVVAAVAALAGFTVGVAVSEVKP
jgi:hypothetical protein